MMLTAWGVRQAQSMDRKDDEWSLPPKDLVPVPWWVIRELGLGWLNYLHEPAIKTLDKAFHLEGHKKGAKPYKSQVEKRTRDWKLALDVLHLMETDGLSNFGAIQQVALVTNMGDDTVKRAWRKNKELVKAAYESWCKTS